MLRRLRRFGARSTRVRMCQTGLRTRVRARNERRTRSCLPATLLRTLAPINSPLSTSRSPDLLAACRLRPGVVSLPHGSASVGLNDLTSADDVDPLTGMPVFSGLRVAVVPV